MMKFNFRLQSILDYRRSLADSARLELTSLQMKLSQAESRLAASRDAERLTLQRLEMQKRQVLDMPLVMQLMEHLNVLGRRVNQQQRAVEEARAAADRQQQLYIDLVKEVKALEKLRERQAVEFAQEQARLDRIETSENAAQQYRRLRIVS